MKIKVGSNWRQGFPSCRLEGRWIRGDHRFQKVQEQWQDVSVPGTPRVIDLSIIPTHQFLSYGERFGYARSYQPAGTISTDRLNLFNSGIIYASCEWGEQGHPWIPAWQWYTMQMAGDHRGVPWPEIGLFNDIPLHFVSNDWQPQYGSTRVWYRSYRDLPRNQNQHRILI